MDGNLNPIGLQSNGNSTSTSLNATSNQGYIYQVYSHNSDNHPVSDLSLGLQAKKMCFNRDCQKKDCGIRLKTTGVEFIMAFPADQESQICARDPCFKTYCYTNTVKLRTEDQSTI